MVRSMAKVRKVILITLILLILSMLQKQVIISGMMGPDMKESGVMTRSMVKVRKVIFVV